MKKKFLVLGVALCTGMVAMAQHTFTLTTDKAVGETFTFRVNKGASLQTKSSGSTYDEAFVTDGNEITITLKGQSVMLKGFGIKDLECTGQGLTKFACTVPTGKTSELETLILSDNKMEGTSAFTATNLKKLTNLRALWIDGNKISGTLDLSKCTLLETLNANGNEYEKVTLPSGTDVMTALEDVSLASNKFETLNLKYCKNLRLLNIEDNNMTQCVLSTLNQKADAVYLDNNQLDYSWVWTKANVSNWEAGTQTYTFAQDKYNIGDEIEAKDYHTDVKTLDQDAIATSYITYNWYSVENGTETKLTRGDNGDFQWKSQAEKNINIFKKPFRQAYLQVTSTKHPLVIESNRIIIDDPEHPFTGIEAVSAKNNLQFSVSGTTLTMTADVATPVTIVNMAGQMVWRGTVSSAVTIQLAHGAYIINNVKVTI